LFCLDQTFCKKLSALVIMNYYASPIPLTITWCNDRGASRRDCLGIPL